MVLYRWGILGIYGYGGGVLIVYITTVHAQLQHQVSFIPFSCLLGAHTLPPHRQQRGNLGNAQEYRQGRERGDYMVGLGGDNGGEQKLTGANADTRGLEQRLATGS